MPYLPHLLSVIYLSVSYSQLPVHGELANLIVIVRWEAHRGRILVDKKEPNRSFGLGYGDGSLDEKAKLHTHESGSEHVVDACYGVATLLRHRLSKIPCFFLSPFLTHTHTHKVLYVRNGREREPPHGLPSGLKIIIDRRPPCHRKDGFSKKRPCVP